MDRNSLSADAAHRRQRCCWDPSLAKIIQAAASGSRLE